VADLGEDLIAKVVYTGGAYPPKMPFSAGRQGASIFRPFVSP